MGLDINALVNVVYASSVVAENVFLIQKKYCMFSCTFKTTVNHIIFYCFGCILTYDCKMHEYVCDKVTLFSNR